MYEKNRIKYITMTLIISRMTIINVESPLVCENTLRGGGKPLIFKIKNAITPYKWHKIFQKSPFLLSFSLVDSLVFYVFDNGATIINLIQRAHINYLKYIKLPTLEGDIRSLGRVSPTRSCERHPIGRASVEILEAVTTHIKMKCLSEMHGSVAA